MKQVLCIVLVFFHVICLAAADKKCSVDGPFKKGQCVRIANHLLYVESFGLPVGKGVSNVVFAPGAGNTHKDWHKVAKQVATFAHVVIYDRSGFGYSQQYETPQSLTAAIVSDNLLDLLSKINIPPPYVLVGHSNGGLTMQYIALQHSKLVSGMVLVDSSTQQLLHWKMFNSLIPKSLKQSDPLYWEELGITPTLKSINTTMQQRGEYPFGDLPMIVLSATSHKKLVFFDAKKERDWLQFQNELAHTSSKATQFYAYRGGHFLPTSRPQLVVDAIYTLIKTRE